MKFMKKSYETNKKRFISGIMAIVMFISALSVTGVITYKKANEAQAAAFVDNNGKYNIPESEGTLGSDTNPFVVLEVVPNASMASFGYLVKGEEPVNINKILGVGEEYKDNSAYKEIADNLGTFVEADESNNVEKKEFKNILTEEKIINEGYVEDPLIKANQYGYFERVDNGKGNYIIDENSSKVTVGTGTYTSSFSETGKNTGDWDYVYEYANGKKGRYNSNSTSNISGKSMGYYENGSYQVGFFNYKTKYSFTEEKNNNRYQVYFEDDGKNNGYYNRVSYSDKYNNKQNFANYNGMLIWKVGNKRGCISEVPVEDTEQKDVYEYTFRKVNYGEGNYIFVPQSYEVCTNLSDKEKEEYPFKENYTFKVNDAGDKADLADEKYDELKGYVTETPVYVKYKKGKGYTNSDLFKKFGIGLAYKGNDIKKGEDVSKYEFKGWYTEKQCVNLANENMRLYKDTTFYAKWVAKYPTDEINEAAGETDPTKMYIPNYTISFDGNISGTANEDIADMPLDITYIESGKSLIAPSSVPKYPGKVFEGWYTDKACTNKYLFSTPVKSNLVLYANWVDLDEKRFTIKFDANTPNADDMNSVELMPEEIKDYCRNGRREFNFMDATPMNDPKLAGYEFAGWYYNKACTKAFSFSTTLPDNIETDTITLYAKWVPVNSKVYRLTLDMNKPEEAVGEVDVKSIKTIIDAEPSGYIKDAKSISDSKPSLEGNISAKINKYKVKVITITPDDLKGDYADNNMKLIDRANLIVFNQTVNKELVNIFKNDNLRADSFGKRAYSYNNKTLGGISNSTDLNWEATLRIFKKVAYGNDGSGKGIAPIIFDSNIINDIKTANVTSTKYITNDNQTITMDNSTKNKGTVSNQNIFKLYLLTQQMNPVTFYNAYINGGSETAEIGDNGSFISNKDASNNNKTAAWSFKTLFPVEAITAGDWNTYNDNGAASGIAQVVGFNDNPLYTENTVNNRAIVTENVLTNFINRKQVVADESMKDYYKEVSSLIYTDAYNYDMTDAMYYLTHAKVAISNFDEKLNVLDIEPSDGDGAFKNQAFWFWFVSKYIGNFSSKVNVTKKSSWEFAGDIDDLNSKYDLIYFGDKLILNDAYKKTIPDDYLYVHTGAKDTSNNTSRAGSLEDKGKNTHITEFVFSGNDITFKKYEDLLDYAEAGYPLVFGRGLFKYTDSINGNIDADYINISKVDTASYVYKLMKTVISNKKYSDSVFAENQYGASNTKKFREALEIKKFSIKMISQPIEYVDKSTNSSYTGDVYINENNISNKALNYRFTINSKSTNTYSLRIYIDTNADGRFVNEEKLDSLEIYDTTARKHIRYNKLIGGHTYEVNRVIEEYVGAIPWKLELVDNANTLVRDSVKGMCAIKAEKKIDINVLQIIANHNSNTGFQNNFYFPTEEEIDMAADEYGEINISNKSYYFYKEGATPTQKPSSGWPGFGGGNWGGTSNSNITGYIKGADGNYLTNKQKLKNSGEFYYYISTLDNFNVTFDRMTVAEFENKVKEQNENNLNKSDDEKNDFMDDYNMLVLGYADAFSDVNDTACEVINKFINEGNTTLFTHDTTSYINFDTKAEFEGTGTNDPYFGYNINQFFRNILGMDRYDVMTNKGLISKMGETCQDKPYKPGGEQSDNNLYKVTGAGDKNRVLNQGMTNVTVANNSDRINSVTKTNDGQIVSYPFKIPDTFTCATTHNQYYQLDLEEDDIVVWYCLTDKSSKYYNVKNDVRNNYYIYNKGNITYTGVGHADNMSDTEIKLFANTLIASYNATVQATEPVITNSDKSTDNNKTDYVYVDYDATVSESDSVPFGEGVFGGMSVKKFGNTSIDTTTKRIYFTLKNNSIVMNKEMTVHYFPAIYDDASGTFKQLSQYPLPLKTYRIENDSVKNNRSDTELPEVDESTISVEEGIFADNDSKNKVSLTGGVVESNWEYYVDVPITDEYYNNIIYGDDNKTFKALDKENEFAIQIQVIMRYGRDQSANVPLKGFRNVLLMRRGMFSLD